MVKYLQYFVFNYVQPITNQKLFKKQPCNQSSHYEVATMKSTGDPLQKKAITYETTLLVVSKDEWNAKECTGECIVHCMYCGIPKGTSRKKQHQTVKKSSLLP